MQCLVVLYTASQNVLKCAQHLFSSVTIEPEEFLYLTCITQKLGKNAEHVIFLYLLLFVIYLYSFFRIPFSW